MELSERFQGSKIEKQRMDDKDFSPEDLLEMIRNGNDAAFAELYRNFHGKIFRFVWQMSGSRSAAEDILQEVFLVVFQKLGNFDRSRGSLSSYLFGIARISVMRWLEENKEHKVPLEDASEHASNGKETPFTELSREESIAKLRKAILSLPEQYREVIVLCELQELSYSEAASVIGCALGTVRSRLHRARALLVQKLESFNTKPSEDAAGGMSYELSAL